MADKIITTNIKGNKAINKDSTIADLPLPFIIGETDAIKEFNKRFNIKFDFKEANEYAFVKSDSGKKIQIGLLDLTDNKTVPNVNGMLLDDAISLLENRGLKVFFIGKGKVMSQSIPVGSSIIKGSLIQLYLN